MAFYYVKEIVLDENDTDMKMEGAFNEYDQYISLPENAHFLCKERNIRPELANPNNSVCSVGFCETDGKWYGWSHRAIYGFGIGSKSSKGDTHYTASTPEELIEQHEAFWADITMERRYEILDDRSGIVMYTANDGTGVVLPCGRGEWEATTLSEARQMACDFAESVS